MFNKDIARANDARLLELAKYIESKGTTKHIKGMSVVFRRFGYLKSLLRNGTFPSVDELEDSVYKLFGIVDKDLDCSEDSDIIAQMMKMAEYDLAERDRKEQDNGNPQDKH